MSFPRYPEYKDSGVEWLGEVPSHWSTGSIRWLARRYSGGTPDKTNPAFWEDGTVPWLNSGAVNDRLISEPSTYITEDAFKSSSAKWIPEGALVMALAGQGKTKGMVAQLTFASTCNQSMAAIIPGSEINSRFLYWWLESNYQNIRNMAGGDLRDGLNLELLGDIKCPLPLAEEQRAITTFLDRETAKIDGLVAEQEKLIALLQEKRQAVISHAVTQGLDSNVPMKDSGVEWLGEVPAHWECIRLKQLVIESVAGPYGASLTKAMYAPDGYRVYGQQQVIADDFSVGDYFISEEKYGEMRRYTVFEGDVLVSVMGTIGKVAVVPPDAPPGIINPRLVRYRCGDLIQPRYLQSVLMCQKHQEHLVLESNGTTMDGLNMVTLGRVPIPTPPIDEQTQILRYLKDQGQKFDPLINEARTAITLLQERRTALISAAVTGQIDVRGLVGGANAPDLVAASAYPESA